MSLHFTCAAALRAAVAVLLRSPFRFPARLAQVGVSTALAVTLFCQEVQAAEPPAPTVTGVSPASGPTDGGTLVTLTGTDFTTAHAVFFGASAAGGWVVNSDTQITAYSPSGSAGVVSITVTTPSGTSATSAANQFTYVPAADLAMTLTDAPDPVQAGDNLTYTLTITNNGPDAAVEPAFSDVLPTALTFVSLTSPEGWDATTPAVGANGTINASAATLASGASAVFTLVVAVDTTTSDDTTLTNTATVSATTGDP
ncbi:MAG TPA: IPT/TIG domain-containing protein, partial [Opitutus sp.]|nr:IPT/TIG domain-containing protein [Opitutus sp.]